MRSENSQKSYLLPVLLILYRVHSAAWFGRETEVKLGILAESTGITQEWILLIIVDGPEEKKGNKRFRRMEHGDIMLEQMNEREGMRNVWAQFFTQMSKDKIKQNNFQPN